MRAVVAVDAVVVALIGEAAIERACWYILTSFAVASLASFKNRGCFNSSLNKLANLFSSEHLDCLHIGFVPSKWSSQNLTENVYRTEWGEVRIKRTSSPKIHPGPPQNLPCLNFFVCVPSGDRSSLSFVLDGYSESKTQFSLQPSPFFRDEQCFWKPQFFPSMISFNQTMKLRLGLIECGNFRSSSVVSSPFDSSLFGRAGVKSNKDRSILEVGWPLCISHFTTQEHHKTERESRPSVVRFYRRHQIWFLWQQTKLFGWPCYQVISLNWWWVHNLHFLAVWYFEMGFSSSPMILGIRHQMKN